MLDQQKADDIRAERTRDHEVDGRAGAASGEGGAVTLRGSLSSRHERQQANEAAARVRGLHGITDELEVRPHAEDRRADAVLCDAVLRALVLDSRIPLTVRATARAGVVTLTGTVPSVYERAEAEAVAGRVPGVVSVENRTRPDSVEPVATDVARRVRRALGRTSQLDANPVVVSAGDGWVILTGRVRSWDEHDTAVDAAWAAPGATVVEDRLTVLP